MIQLRALEPSDLEMLYEVENDRQLWAHSDTSAPYSHFALRQFIKRSLQEDIYAQRQLRLVVEHIEGNQHTAVGLVDLFDFSPMHHRAEVGIVILPAHRRQGFGLDALTQLSQFAADRLAIHSLTATILADNVPSLQLFERAGFRQIGQLADWYFDPEGYKNAILLQKML
ncbi:MAG: GNAT family N-acetyltransferase [Bacteroidaceae bacterium]|nr:GNAT family N-acetyltransferase [Bacteroidaceae bacterium]